MAIDHCLPLRHRFVTFPGAGVTTLDSGVDVTLCGLYPSMKAYVVLPFIATSEDDESKSDRRHTDSKTAK